MKKILITLMVVICSFSMTTYGQILNPGFENWTSGNPDDWATSNAFPASLVNITQTSDSHSGSSALLGQVINFMGSPFGPVIQSGTMATGFPITEKYYSFELYYKFTSVGGDKFSVNVGLFKGTNLVAQGAAALPATVSSYTHLIVPLTYITTDIPDLAVIQLMITGPVTGNDVHIGSVMYMDDLAFSLTNGIADKLSPGLTAKCYPNPARDIVTIPLNDAVSGDVTLSVYDSRGKEIKQTVCQPQQPGNNSIQLSVVDLLPGLYFFTVSGQNIPVNGKFTVNR